MKAPRTDVKGSRKENEKKKIRKEKGKDRERKVDRDSHKQRQG